MDTKKENDVLPDLPVASSEGGSAETKAMRKYREKIKARYPDANPQSDDEWFELEDRYADEVEDQLAKNEADSELIKEGMMAQPELAMLVHDIFVNKLPLSAALARHYSVEDLIPKDGDDDFESYRTAEQERVMTAKKRAEIDKEIDANQEASIAAIDAYSQKKGYSEEQTNKLLDFINDTFQDLLMKKVSEQVLEAFDKAMNYDSAVASAAEAGETNGKNAAIELKKAKEASALAGDGVPTPGKGGALKEKEIGKSQRIFGDIGKRKGI